MQFSRSIQCNIKFRTVIVQFLCTGCRIISLDHGKNYFTKGNNCKKTLIVKLLLLIYTCCLVHQGAISIGELNMLTTFQTITTKVYKASSPYDIMKIHHYCSFLPVNRLWAITKDFFRINTTENFKYKWVYPTLQQCMQ